MTRASFGFHRIGTAFFGVIVDDVASMSVRSPNCRCTGAAFFNVIVDDVASMAYTFQQNDTSRTSGHTGYAAVRTTMSHKGKGPGGTTASVASRPAGGR